MIKLGFFTMPVHPVGRTYTETLREDFEFTVLADRLGFVEGFFGEHLTDPAEAVTSSPLFIAWVLEATRQIRLGTGTVNLPNRHPAMVAGEIAMLDHMAKGRLIMGISPGGLMSDAEIFGNLGNDRNAMLVEAIDHILALWSQEPPYRRQGKYWTVTTERTHDPATGQGRVPRPYQTPHPPIVVTAVAPFSQGIVPAAARGFEPISANFLLPQWVKSHWGKYVEGCAQGGRAARPENWRVAKSIFVADDLATARRYATEPGGPYYGYYQSLGGKLIKYGRGNLFKRDQSAPDASVTVEGIVEDLVIWGTPDKVADDLLAFRDEIGDFGTLLYAGHDWADKTLARRSMELLAEKVMPAVNAG